MPEPTTHNRHAMIMAGGSGTRLWPVSRAERPKQLIDLIEDRPSSGSAPGRRVSLLELAARRLEGLVSAEHRLICTGERYRAVIESVLPAFTGDRLLGEPAPRDTVNAVGFVAAVLEATSPGAVFAVLTADHVIEPDDAFQAAMRTGFELVEQDPARLVTFSITPTHPATGFGYVEKGDPIPGKDNAFRVERFVEKPDLARATAFVEAGTFGWNSGMFVFSARTILDCLKRFVPESAAGLAEIAAAWTTPDRQAVLDRVYPTLPKISVDYAIMEPAAKADDLAICGVEMPVRWLDVGSWPSYAETLDADEQGNRVSGPGHAAVLDGKDNLLVNAGSTEHAITLVGCDGLVVVRTDDATLVMPAAEAQRIKELHAGLPDRLK